VGKWHLGHCDLKYTPCQRGFDTFYGFFGGMVEFLTHRMDNDVQQPFSDKTEHLSGLDFWDQTRDSLHPVTDKNGTFIQVKYNFIYVKNKII
jgi:arylsulfatase B